MGLFDLFRLGHNNQATLASDLDYILERNIKPIKKYIENKQYDEAWQALHNATLNLMNHLDPDIQSHTHFLIEEEVKRVFSNTSGLWYVDFVYNVLTDVREIGYKIDVETNLKVGAYAICELFNSISQNSKAPFYFKDFAKKHSII